MLYIRTPNEPCAFSVCNHHPSHKLCLVFSITFNHQTINIYRSMDHLQTGHKFKEEIWKNELTTIAPTSGWAGVNMALTMTRSQGVFREHPPPPSTPNEGIFFGRVVFHPCNTAWETSSNRIYVDFSFNLAPSVPSVTQHTYTHPHASTFFHSIFETLSYFALLYQACLYIKKQDALMSMLSLRVWLRLRLTLRPQWPALWRLWGWWVGKPANST